MTNEINNTHCSCCGQRIRVWRKPLVGTAIAELIKLYNIYKRNNQSVHISEFSKQRSNFYTLKYWGLIEGSDKVIGKRTAGMWIPTQEGIDFINNKITIPSHAETFNNKLIRLCGEDVNVRQALGKKFDYDELIENN